MLTDHMPTINDTDDYILNWVHNNPGEWSCAPKVYVPLEGATSLHDPDTAIINFDQRDRSVDRIRIVLPFLIPAIKR